MEKISLLTIGLSKVLQRILTESFIKIRPLKVIGHFVNIDDFLEYSALTEPSVIVIESHYSSECLDILYLYPRASVVLIKNAGKRFIIWRMKPTTKLLGEISSDELVRAIIFIN